MINIEALNLEEKVSQMLMFAFHGTALNEQLRTFVEEFKLGGVVYFHRNIDNINQISCLNKELQDKSGIPLFIAIDQEGGPVRRILQDITPLPAAMALGSAAGHDIYQICRAVGSDLHSLGFNINFAPVADINNNPLNPVINSRSYGDNPVNVADCVVNAVSGFQDAFILPTVKHFPGHGNTDVDSHLGMPVVRSRKRDLERIELFPFARAIEAGADGIMASHIIFSAYDRKYPSSLSYNIITKLLKKKMNFNGLICTDSLTMGAIAKHYSFAETIKLAVTAGIDLLVFCGKADLDEQRHIRQVFINLVTEKIISLKRINESVGKILAMKEKYANGITGPRGAKKNNHEALAGRLYSDGITLVKSNGILPLNAEDKILILFPELKISTFVDNAEERYVSLGSFLSFEEQIISEATDLSAVAKKAETFKKVIFATYNVSPNDRQVKLFDLLDKKNTILISLRSPYDLNYLAGAQTYICTYEATWHSLYYLSKCLSGEQPFRGKLPVKLEVK